MKINWKDAQSVQSGTGRLSCSRTALKRCTSTETRWYRWLVSLVSPEIEEILLPRSFRSRTADALKTPKVSRAIGSNMWRPTMSAYFASLRVAANSAAARAASVTYDSARGQDTVTSQHNDLPLATERVWDHLVSSRQTGTAQWALEECQEEKDLGVLFSNNLKVGPQYNLAFQKANRMLRLLKRMIDNKTPQTC